MSNAFLGIDTGSISTKGVIVLPDGTIIARSTFGRKATLPMQRAV